MPQVQTRITLTLLGHLVSLKNGRQLVTIGGKPRFIPKPAALEWERIAQMQIPPDHRLNLEGPIRLTATIYYANKLSDLDESLLMDVLQERTNRKSGITTPGLYRNDNAIVEKYIYKKLDKANPRVELVVEELSEYDL